MKLRRSKKGFTIVELVIVVGVIGILSAVLIPTFVNLTKTAKESAQQLELRNAYSAYAADAADGYVGEDEDETKTLVLKGQAEIALAKAGNLSGANQKVWVWNATDKKYEELAKTVTAVEHATVAYNNYYVYTFTA